MQSHKKQIEILINLHKNYKYQQLRSIISFTFGSVWDHTDSKMYLLWVKCGSGRDAVKAWLKRGQMSEHQSRLGLDWWELFEHFKEMWKVPIAPVLIGCWFLREMSNIFCCCMSSDNNILYYSTSNVFLVRSV